MSIIYFQFLDAVVYFLAMYTYKARPQDEDEDNEEHLTENTLTTNVLYRRRASLISAAPSMPDFDVAATNDRPHRPRRCSMFADMNASSNMSSRNRRHISKVAGKRRKSMLDTRNKKDLPGIIEDKALNDSSMPQIGLSTTKEEAKIHS